MPKPAELAGAVGVAGRFGAFVAERHPFAIERALAAFDEVAQKRTPTNPAAIDALRAPLRHALRHRLADLAPRSLPETTPGVAADHRLTQAVDEIVEACDGFLRREAIALSLTPDERREILRAMVLARATDNRLKAFYLGSDVKYRGVAFQGKGYRSLGQEAIAGAAIRLHRGAAYRSPDGTWGGDIVSPIIRDLALEMLMGPEIETIRMAMAAQIGKALPPMYGKDLHRGDFASGLLPAIAPLGTGALTIAGLAMAFARERSDRVAIALNGEGGTSLGEWHEAINLCAARRLPAIFCVENNQTALSTPLADQSAVRVFADKAAGYGMPGITIDGTDPDRVAAAFTWAAERAREGAGPTLIELTSMRMCGHAHHDDMLYLGREPQISWDYPPATPQGYVNRELYAYWTERDPIKTYAARLEAEGLIERGELERLKREADTIVEEQAQVVIAAPWPDGQAAGVGVFADEPPRRRTDPLASATDMRAEPSLPSLDPGPPVDRQGQTFLDGVMLGLRDALRADSRVFIYGEDVGRRYGNAFLLLRPLLEEFGDRILNAPIAESGILGVCIGAALGGQRPIGEMQFNDFVATGFNQLVNSAAKTRYRWGASVPMVLRMPWGGLRHAGPFHSQNTEAWFYRTPGLKMVVPSTPADARALMASALADPDPVLYYEHIALYRDPRIKQSLAAEPPAPIPLGRAALRRAGRDLAIISYGAFVHIALRVAESLARDGIEASVLDLRSLAPLDRAALLAVARYCARVLIVHEDTRTGGIGESLAAIIQEEAFEWLDAPIRIIGALDTPVPYSPPLEEYFLPSESEIEAAAKRLVAY